MAAAANFRKNSKVNSNQTVLVAFVNEYLPSGPMLYNISRP